MADLGFGGIINRFQSAIQGAMGKGPTHSTLMGQGTPKGTSGLPKVSPKGVMTEINQQVQQMKDLAGGKSQIPGQGSTNIKVGKPGAGIKMGGIPGAIAYTAGNALIPHISREAVRGALVVTGQDTTDYDRLNAGQPVVRNLGGVSYNIATPEGRSGYNAALKAGVKPSEPTDVSTPKTYTVSGVTYDSPTGQAINPDTGKPSPGGYSIDPSTSKRTDYASGADRGAGLNPNRGPAASDFKDNPDEAMAIWARTHGKLAQEVVDKVEKRGLQQSGYAAIKSVLQPEMYPTQMAGEQPNIPYSADNTGVEGLRRTDTPEVSVDIKTKGESSTYAPQYNASDADKLKVEPDGLIMSSGEIVKIPDQTGVAPQTLPAGFPEAQKEAQAFFSKNLKKIKGK